ncbi:myo-inositol 2-dehydrogenase/D-chiro-inositol 1-dehydrogenase [Paenarthrobacter nitroguajacolicus]|uniref:Gfo/Idh/MocA family oxidoreductase n=1 Tax=Paenarthrobacter nitroguajacolicus TaxID=211146 RepID=UPI0028573E4F|nr:Gfo/Idh/MocA family oxidoreductase [Paenarthrobacter nitroguajacolicus]MDR6989165.1 myo-inositol 2-dehydrogenase/D-chiro-inositol 1-dehydrogenase [Paenarthrobacter nitroguajacolicus]
MTQQIRVALFGTGRIGQVHAMSLAMLEEATLAWVCDPFIEGAKRTAAEYGGRVSDDPDEVFASGEVDAIIVASPTATHVDLIEKSIDAGIPVLCEKPIDLEITRVDALRAKAAATDIPIVLGFNKRFDRHFVELRRRVGADEIGALEQLIITSRDPGEPPAAYLPQSGGIFRDMTIHDLDMARYFIPDIVEVSAQGANVFSDAIRQAGDFDSTVVTLRGSKDELITIFNSRHSAFGYDQRIEAFGSAGLLHVSNKNDNLVRHWGARSVEGIAPYQNFFLERYAEAYRLEVAEFLRAVRGLPYRNSGFEDGRAALILANAAEESARSGTSIAVDLS